MILFTKGYILSREQSQSGSAHLAIIIVLCFALVGALGFIFYQNVIQVKAKKSIQRDVERRNDASHIIANLAIYAAGHKGNLPSDLEFTDGTFVSNYMTLGVGVWNSPSGGEYSIKLSGQPGIDTFIFVRGENCDGAIGDRKMSVKIMLESGNEFCQSY